ncbi:MAG: glucose-6-phosphate dehydrogenase [Pseudomonadota bacterium]|nr:glucose-6-phosphate dehydrogenase [Pseudomonadota bacterium]
MTDDTQTTTAPHSDALVLFGFTGDLANKKIFPALYAMAKRGELVPRVVGVAGRSQTDDEVHRRVRDSIEKEGGGIDDGAAFDKLQQAIRYVGGDYNKPETFDALKKALDGSKRPAHYLAVPPTLFETVIKSLGSAGLAKDARLIVEKPFGRDLASARELDAVARSVFPEEAIFRIDHYLGKEAIMNLLYFRFANSFLDPLWCREHIASVQMTMSEDFGVGDRGAFYETAGALRDVVENHLFQIVALLAMEPPKSRGFADLQAAKAEVFKALRPLRPEDMVRGQYDGYRQEKDVAPDSDVETYVALRLFVDSPRWQGVPFHLRAGKKLPDTAVEVQIQFKPPRQALFEDAGGRPNYLRLRLQPTSSIALAARVKDVGKRFVGQQRELYACEDLRGEEAPYDRLLGDAMAGDGSLFTSLDAVEAAWTAVDDVLVNHPKAVAYQAGTWGPAQADALVAGDGGWQNPMPENGCADDRKAAK